jgi:4,5-DOPA dioxygenase extradiol
MNAITDNAYSREWRKLGDSLPTPSAILCVSAHWMTRGTTLVHVAARPKTIHDFGGFPQALYDAQYPAPGAPDVARATIELVRASHIKEDTEWGLDHGAWSVLIKMFPKADIPVFQLSLDLAKPPSDHFALAQELKPLREKGVLIVGSGNIVHNLMALVRGGQTYDWAEDFDARAAKAIGQDQLVWEGCGRGLSRGQHGYELIGRNEKCVQLFHEVLARQTGFAGLRYV